MWRFLMVRPINSSFLLWGKSFGPNRKFVVIDLSGVIMIAGKNTGF